MIRTIVKAEKSNLTFQLPESFVGKNVEILAFVLEDEINDFPSFDENVFPALLSEEVLSKDWLSKEEDEAWKNL